MRKIFLIILLITLYGCGGAKYTTTFDNNSLNFSKGKWILNKTFENEKDIRFYEYALKHFRKIIGDSLYEINDVRNISSNLMNAEILFEPSKKDLREIRNGTLCNYLINIKGTVLKDEMSGFAGATTYGSTIKTNLAKVDIRIYDLNSLELISSSSATGKDERELTEEMDWDLVTKAKAIKIIALYKLIKKYKKTVKF